MNNNKRKRDITDNDKRKKMKSVDKKLEDIFYNPANNIEKYKKLKALKIDNDILSMLHQEQSDRQKPDYSRYNETEKALRTLDDVTDRPIMTLVERWEAFNTLNFDEEMIKKVGKLEKKRESFIERLKSFEKRRRIQQRRKEVIKNGTVFSIVPVSKTPIVMCKGVIRLILSYLPRLNVISFPIFRMISSRFNEVSIEYAKKIVEKQKRRIGTRITYHKNGNEVRTPNNYIRQYKTKVKGCKITLKKAPQYLHYFRSQKSMKKTCSWCYKYKASRELNYFEDGTEIEMDRKICSSCMSQYCRRVKFFGLTAENRKIAIEYPLVCREGWEYYLYEHTKQFLNYIFFFSL